MRFTVSTQPAVCIEHSVAVVTYKNIGALSYQGQEKISRTLH